MSFYIANILGEDDGDVSSEVSIILILKERTQSNAYATQNQTTPIYNQAFLPLLRNLRYYITKGNTPSGSRLYYIAILDFIVRFPLYTCRVPGIETTSCECGWRKQDAKHILLFCPLFQESRQHLVRSSGTNDFRKMMKTPKGAKASTQWLIQTGLLGQFSLAQEQLYGG